MQVDIFIRSYSKDFEWLSYALKSIHKYVNGYRNIIVCVPLNDLSALAHLTTERVVGVRDLSNGYIGQQLTKMQAWKYTDADAVLFWDSDTVATEQLNILEEFTSNGKPIIYHTDYAEVGDAQCWQECTQQAIGHPVYREYMRRMPLMYLTKTVLDADIYLSLRAKMSTEQYLGGLQRFSEFNYLGAYAHINEAERYDFRATEHVAPPPSKMRQFWSWGGINEQVQQELKACGL